MFSINSFFDYINIDTLLKLNLFFVYWFPTYKIYFVFCKHNKNRLSCITRCVKMVKIKTFHLLYHFYFHTIFISTLHLMNVFNISSCVYWDIIRTQFT